MHRSAWQIIEGVKSKGKRSSRRWKWKMSMSKNNLGCCSGRPFATQVAENKTRVAATEGEMLMLSMLLLRGIIIIIYNRNCQKIPGGLCRRIVDLTKDRWALKVDGRGSSRKTFSPFSFFFNLLSLNQADRSGREETKSSIPKPPFASFGETPLVLSCPYVHQFCDVSLNPFLK